MKKNIKNKVGLNENIDIFKKIVPKESLGPEDKKTVLKTISTAKLILDSLDIISVKQAKTRIQMLDKIVPSNDLDNSAEK